MEPVYFILVGGGILIAISLIIRLAIGQKSAASTGEYDGHNTGISQSENDMLHKTGYFDQSHSGHSTHATVSGDTSTDSYAEGSSHGSDTGGSSDSFSNSDSTSGDSGGSFSSDSSSSSDISSSSDSSSFSSTD